MFTERALITGFVITTFTAAAFMGQSCGCTGQRSGAEAQARAWAKDMNLEIAGVSCADVDSDHDGYVSCALSVKPMAASGAITVQAIECSSGWSLNSGCRVPKAIVRGQ